MLGKFQKENFGKHTNTNAEHFQFLQVACFIMISHSLKIFFLPAQMLYTASCLLNDEIFMHLCFWSHWGLMSLLLLFIRPKMSERQREKEEGEPFVLSTDEYLYIIFFVYIFFLLYDVNDEDFSRKVFFFISSTLGSENARFRQLINILWLIINYNVFLKSNLSSSSVAPSSKWYK